MLAQAPVFRGAPTVQPRLRHDLHPRDVWAPPDASLQRQFLEASAAWDPLPERFVARAVVMAAESAPPGAPTVAVTVFAAPARSAAPAHTLQAEVVVPLRAIAVAAAPKSQEPALRNFRKPFPIRSSFHN